MALEPEVTELLKFLVAMGADIEGIGTRKLSFMVERNYMEQRFKLFLIVLKQELMRLLEQPLVKSFALNRFIKNI